MIHALNYEKRCQPILSRLNYKDVVNEKRAKDIRNTLTLFFEYGSLHLYPNGNYLFKFNNIYVRTGREVSSRLTIMTLGVFIFNFEENLYRVLMFVFEFEQVNAGWVYIWTAAIRRCS